jgi:SAM-dependent methyltransferase
MPSTVQDHYDNLLAEHYDWMFGDSFDLKVAEQKALLSQVARTARRDELAVDLGCGSGFQSVALQQLGYRVFALDSSEKLLDKLAARVEGRSITLRLGDMRKLDDYVTPATAGIVVCMGDTLTHLSSREEVCDLFVSVARVLKPQGLFILSYRDLAQDELLGLDRFIPIRGDDERVMTCFLEYSNPDTVVVNDLVHVRNGAGQWILHKSSYQKLRLPLEWVGVQLAAAGLSIVLQLTARMVTMVAVKAR